MLNGMDYKVFSSLLTAQSLLQHLSYSPTHTHIHTWRQTLPCTVLTAPQLTFFPQGHFDMQLEQAGFLVLVPKPDQVVFVSVSLLSLWKWTITSLISHLLPTLVFVACVMLVRPGDSTQCDWATARQKTVQAATCSLALIHGLFLWYFMADIWN